MFTVMIEGDGEVDIEYSQSQLYGVKRVFNSAVVLNFLTPNITNDFDSEFPYSHTYIN